ncbi:hypothetical protein [Acidovorax sp. sic0104]|uniref:hypothetical protein n=1 Tax=Acidovorax sp. sic0104 TaxID=2854784 RepID=UPI001C43C61E|nr:hypothetical protein [Acidovorax sp. sic0104]MBV7542236.1 hypothetical protein [Acidovorax sp. sic0104]
MALYEISESNTLSPIPATTFSSRGLYERDNLQKALRAHIHAITPGADTMVLAEEFGDWVGANRRIDLLCLDKDAKLVVVELKRDDGGAHMELQAVRYAAMISAMRFEQAVEAHRRYLGSIGSTADAEQAIREFLDRDDGQPVALHEDVRIVLAAPSFGTEVSTTVLWLNKQGLDLRCVQMRPHLLDGRVLLDIQQVIPLPEAAQYQVAIREKEAQQAIARSSERNVARYNLTIGRRTYSNIPGRRVLFEVVAEALRSGVTVASISAAFPGRGDTVFLSAEGTLSGAELLERSGHSGSGYLIQDNMVLQAEGRTFALSTSWGDQLLDAISSVVDLVPSAGIAFERAQPTGEAQEVSFDGYLIRQDETTTITVSKDGNPCSPVMPVLRALAEKLGVSTLNGAGNAFNTRQLGARVIEAVGAREG